MKPARSQFQSQRAFSLIELLIVISIIAILAAMIIPASQMVNRRGKFKKAESEIAAVANAIESYKAKLGHYPPDNPGNPIRNQLFYELQGTVRARIGGQDVFQTLDGRTNIPVNSVSTLIGPNVSGFVNCSREGGGDDFAAAHKFLINLKPGQFGFLNNGVGVLTSSVTWPENLGPVAPDAPLGLNPIRYNSSNPTGNAKSFDLWIDIVIGGKTNRISNWSKDPEII